MARSIAKSPIQRDSGRTSMFGCWPRHQVRMLVPDRGEPTTKIGLVIGVAANESIFYSWGITELRLFSSPKEFFSTESSCLGRRLHAIGSITVRLKVKK